MSGFFLAAGFALWTVFFGGRTGEKTSWQGWLLGSALGALPLIPWAWAVLQHPTGHALWGSWDDRLQLKFWVFWVSDPLGLHLGNTLGLLRGNSNWVEIREFLGYPLVGGHATYLVGAAHALILAVGAWVLGGAVLRFLRRAAGLLPRARLAGEHSPVAQTLLAQRAAFWGMGILLTATAVNIRRYYLAASFPFEFVFLAGLALQAPEWGPLRPRWLLALLWAAELFVSAAFVNYIHLNGGALQGDYGPAYHRVIAGRVAAGANQPESTRLDPK
jgi:hypothetical protein